MNPGFIGLGQLGARLASVALKADQSIVVFDLDPSKVSSLSRQGAAVATSVVDLAPVILNGSLNTGFTTDLGLKDLGFVVDLGEKYQVPLKLTHLVKSQFEASRDKYGGDAWTPHVVKMLEEEVGDELRAEGFPDVIQVR